MSTQLTRIMGEAKDLPLQEKLKLVSWLANEARREAKSDEEELNWEDIKGTMPYPACGEDAQAWVTRTRKESQAKRDKMLGGRG